MTATKAKEQPSVGRELLFDILSWARPHDSECETAFLKHYLDVMPEMQKDEFGNRFLRIGDGNVMWSCHVDTVASKGGLQRLRFNTASGIVELDNGKPGQSLGADDGAGVWIMMEMIRHERPGLYVFHRGEERGCLGSSWIAKHRKEMFDGIDIAMAFDRAHREDVITHQSFGRTCSDDFAQSFASQLNRLEPTFGYKPDDTGVYTDTNEYAGYIKECSNISVGYFGQHGPRETLDVYHIEKLRDVMLKFDISELVVARDPDVWEDDRYLGYGYTGGWPNYGVHSKRAKTPTEEMIELVEDHPAKVAEMLIDFGVTVSDMYEMLFPPKPLYSSDTPESRMLEAHKRAWSGADEAEWEPWNGDFNEEDGDGDPVPVDEAILPDFLHNEASMNKVRRLKRGKRGGWAKED